MNHLTSLRDDTRKNLEKIGDVDIIVGIPCYGNEKTIRNVIENVGEGLKKYYKGEKSLIFISDGGSLDDTREEAEAAAVPSSIDKIVTIYRGVAGKGSAFRCVFEAASLLGVKGCAVFDSDLISITPEWVKRLLEPVLKDNFEYVTPGYKRDKNDGTITNNIVYPMTRMLYGLNIRQPIGGDFGFSGKLAKTFKEEEDVWNTDIAKFGIDIWMTTTAIVRGKKICKSDMGAKIHEPKEPGANLRLMFIQVVWTLFTQMIKYEDKWLKISKTKKVKTYNIDEGIPPEPVEVSSEPLLKELEDGFKHFGRLWEEITSNGTFKDLKRCVKSSKIHLPANVWTRVIYDFASVFRRWERNRHKLVNLLIPLYLGRVGTFIGEVEELSNEEAEEKVVEQAKIFEEMKDYLIKRWLR